MFKNLPVELENEIKTYLKPYQYKNGNFTVQDLTDIYINEGVEYIYKYCNGLYNDEDLDKAREKAGIFWENQRRKRLRKIF